MFDRASGIGGSDVAAILGISPYRSTFDVWLEKTHDPAHTPTEDSPQMRFGRLMEPVLAKVYEEDHPGSTVELKGGAHTDPQWHPNHVCYAHVDGFVGEGIWEGKTAWDDRDWQAGVPAHYEAQARTYLAITRAPWCDFTVCFRQTARFEHYRVEADAATDDGCITFAERWWRDYVETGTPPPIDGSPGAAAFILSRHPMDTIAETLKAPPEVDQIGRSLIVIRANLAQVEEAEARAKNMLKAAMGEYGKIEGTGWTATYRRAKGATLTGWREVASAYGGLLNQIGAALRAGRVQEAERLLTDNDPATIVGLYTTTGAGSRPFVFKTEKE